MTADFGFPANEHSATLAEVGEGETLRRIFPRLPHAAAELLGPGDDAAVVAAPDGRFVVTTDMMVHGPDFRTAWSTPHDLGWKAAMTNLADVAAMGARPTALVVAIAAPLDTPVEALLGIADGLRDGCAAAAPGCGVVGGDLSVSSALTLTVTAFGDLEGRAPVTRSGARPGDVLAVAGELGRAGAGIWLLFRDGVTGAAGGWSAGAVEEGRSSGEAGADASGAAGGWSAGAAEEGRSGAEGADASGSAGSGRVATPAVGAGAGAGVRPEAASGVVPGEPDAARAAVLRRDHADIVEAQLRPTVPVSLGVAAALGGATAMLDVSDGLALDARRIAVASGCTVRLDPGAIAREARDLIDLDAVVGDHAVDFVLAGGEDHALLAAFPPGVPLPTGFRALGTIVDAGGAAPVVLLGDRPYDELGGWDPYADWNGEAG
ncbi:AIR synthase related protein [Herbiconiux sp. 11R-BC]|uniref:thiamine-phosphate kinase n=1 Tax=Herbiconiux sp. 11R-BC TaxID=3111637 RepID=UPI003C0C660E